MGTQPRFVVLFDETETFTVVRGQKALKRLIDSIVAGDDENATVYEGVIGGNLTFVREVTSEA